MKAVDFSKTLKAVDQDLQPLIHDGALTLQLPQLDEEKLDLAQREIWRRVQFMEFSVAGVDDGCKACCEMLAQEAETTSETIHKYLTGKLTKAQEIGSITYESIDKSAAATIMITLEDGEPRVISAPTELAKLVQAALTNPPQQPENLAAIKLPQTVNDYHPAADKLFEAVLFEEELVG